MYEENMTNIFFFCLAIQKCDIILTELWAQDESCPFVRPVDKKQVTQPDQMIH